MQEIETTIHALAAIAFLLYLTPAIGAFGVSARGARRFQRAALLIFAIAMALAIGATIHWSMEGP
jgi:hypothetical protein